MSSPAAQGYSPSGEDTLVNIHALPQTGFDLLWILIIAGVILIAVGYLLRRYA